MSAEFIVLIIFGIVQLAGLLIPGGMLRELSVSTRIDVLHGRRIEDVLRAPREGPHT